MIEPDREHVLRRWQVHVGLLVGRFVQDVRPEPAEIRARLVEQVTGTVRWRECVAHMAAQGVTLFVELGSGKVLTGLAKKNAPNAQAIAIGTPDDFAAALPLLKG